jgi:hypothetical protein
MCKQRAEKDSKQKSVKTRHEQAPDEEENGTEREAAQKDVT